MDETRQRMGPDLCTSLGTPSSRSRAHTEASVAAVNTPEGKRVEVESKTKQIKSKSRKP